MPSASCDLGDGANESLRGGKQLKSRRAGERPLRHVLFEKHVERRAGSERRVNADQTHASVLDVPPQDFEAVAEVDPVLPAHAGQSITGAGADLKLCASR